MRQVNGNKGFPLQVIFYNPLEVESLNIHDKLCITLVIGIIYRHTWMISNKDSQKMACLMFQRNGGEAMGLSVMRMYQRI